MHPDAVKIGSLAAEFMDELGEDDEVGIVGIVVEVKYKNEDGVENTGVRYYCSDERSWIQAGLFDFARLAALGED